MWALLYTKAAKYIAAIVAFCAAVAAIYFKGKGAGKQKEQAKRTEEKLQEVKQASENMQQKLENKTNVETEVAKLPDGAAADKLRSDWSRD